MERLTERYGCNGVKLVNEEEYAPMVAQCLAMHKLAAYEDTDLSPDEISHWIPVSERMPEPETSVLVLQSYIEGTPYARISIGHLHQESDLRRKPYWMWIAYGADMVNPKIEDYHRAAFICPGDEFVTHWMPLPKLPKEKNDAES